MLTDTQKQWLTEEFLALPIDEQKRWLKSLFKILSVDEMFGLFLRLVAEIERLNNKAKADELLITTLQMNVDGLKDKLKDLAGAYNDEI